MKQETMMKVILLACCLVGVLVLPAAAASSGQGTASTIDQGLKNDLWNSQMQYRMQTFDANVQHANEVISILGQYGIDTTQMQATLSSISDERSALQSAFASQDRSALMTVNSQLLTLWKQYLQEMRTAVRDHYVQASTGTSAAGMSDATDFVSSNTGASAL
jgi:hypothetical protein